MIWAPDPKVFMIAHTAVDRSEMQSMLEALGAPDWLSRAGMYTGDAELLTEAVGRMCYKSYEVGLNPNVTRIRDDGREYIGNILRSRHGSVLEHASVTFGMIGVSRVFTHEIVRHRAGTAFSQESMRFVRVENLNVWMPGVFDSYEVTSRITEEDSAEITGHMNEAVSAAERAYLAIARILNFDGMKDFGLKKRLTSAMRRILPDGISTNIAVTANHRAWRHIISVRSSIHAEEELRLVIDQIARTMQARFPDLYQDMVQLADGSWAFDNDKV